MTNEAVAEFQQASGGAVTLTRCDITDEGAVNRWARDVATETDSELDLLISNAGILTSGPLEVLPLNAIRREFEANLFGALSVINAFLPALRKARGRIVQISTWTASLPLPFNGPSNAAMEKFATVYPRRTEAVWHRRGDCGARQYANGRPGENGRRPYANR